MLGMKLVTKQTGAEGKIVRKLYIEEGSSIKKEYYLAMLLERETASCAIMFSTEGGMDIEEVAEKSPEKIVTVNVDTTIGLKGFHIRELIFRMQLPKEEHKAFAHYINQLYKLFLKYDFSMLEINPLVVCEGEMF